MTVWIPRCWTSSDAGVCMLDHEHSGPHDWVPERDLPAWIEANAARYM